MCLMKCQGEMSRSPHEISTATVNLIRVEAERTWEEAETPDQASRWSLLKETSYM